MKAGAFTPAIPEDTSPVSACSTALNEGGGFHPAIRFSMAASYRFPSRSMKAGAFTPAIPADPLDRDVALGRSMKAGAFTPAIRDRSHCLEVGLDRSMKAGAFTPAIHTS